MEKMSSLNRKGDNESYSKLFLRGNNILFNFKKINKNHIYRITTAAVRFWEGPYQLSSVQQISWDACRLVSSGKQTSFTLPRLMVSARGGVEFRGQTILISDTSMENCKIIE